MQFDILEHRKGIIGTILFHIVLFVVLYFSYFEPAEPVFPDPEGITVNFGDSETGQGLEEPGEVTPMPEEVRKPQVVEAEVGPDADPSVNTPEVVQDKVLAQDMEDAPAMEELKKKQEQKKKIEQEADKKRREIADLKKKAEDAEVKRVEAEKQRLEAERKKIDAINNRAKNAFGSGTGANQGVTTGAGNQGKPDGDPNADNYSNGKSTGNGVDWSLDGRSAISVPRPSSGIQEEGKVVVEIIVDKDGNVVDARGGLIGSTTTDSRLVKLATEAAAKAKFNVSPNAPERQKGKITYIFELK